MPVAAIPRYLGQNFSSASPGMRFGMYLALWTSPEDQERETRQRAGKKSAQARELKQYLNQHGMEQTIAHLVRRNKLPGLWEKNDSDHTAIWRNICALTPQDQALTRALLQRQQAQADTYPTGSLWHLPAQSTAPFTTGLGNEHPLENGFAFLWPYGLPYLPGSGVKGVIRQAALELAQGVWGDRQGWSEEKTYTLKIAGKNRALNMTDILLGLQSSDGDDAHFRGVLSFWDVIPRIHGAELAVDIMTPHQKHYYQDGASPHESGQPLPLSFLTLPPNTDFAFYLTCDLPRLKKLAPDLLTEEAGLARWQQLLNAAFEHAFQWLGFGAKTAVGYGVMQIDPAESKRRARQAEQQRKAEQAKAEQQQKARQAAAKQAAFDALPVWEKAAHELQAALSGLPASFNKNNYSQLVNAISAYLKNAKDWPLEARQAAVDRVTALYDQHGWAQPGQSSNKKKKQRQKKRRQLDDLLN